MQRNGNGRPNNGPRVARARAFDAALNGRSGESVASQPPIPLALAGKPPPFPIAVLPGILRDYVHESALASNTPPDFTAGSMLGVTGAAIGNTLRLHVKDDYYESACLWLMLVGRTSTRKSVPLNNVPDPMFRAQMETLPDDQRKRDQWEQMTAVRRGSEPPPPIRRWLTTDPTVESLIDILSENPRGILLLKDEMMGFFAGLDQYKAKGRGSDAQNYLSIFSHSAIFLDRKNHKGPRSVRRPFVSICGGIQPNKLVELADSRRVDEQGDDDLLNRFLVCYPDRLPAKEEQWLTLSAGSARTWLEVMVTLMKLKMDGKIGRKVPRIVRLTDDARLAWVEATRRHADEVNDPEFPDFLHGPWGKLCPNYLGRLALVLHMLRWACDEVDSKDVDGESVRRSETLVNYFKAHSRRSSSMSFDPRIAKAHMVLRWLSNHLDLNQFSRSDVWQALRKQMENHYPQSVPSDLNRPLGLLVEHRYLTVANDAQDAGGLRGRPETDRFSVNPSWDRGVVPDGEKKAPA